MSEYRSVRFVHTSDWQLGMTRHYLSSGDQELYSQAQFDVIRHIGRVAQEQKCQFIVVSGDVFDSNRVHRRTVLRALEALKEVDVPIYLLPGNHDCLDAGSVYRSSTFIEQVPGNVHIMTDSVPIEVTQSCFILGAPWKSKRPVTDLVSEAVTSLDFQNGISHICVAHGAVDTLSPDPSDPANIQLSILEKALEDGKLSYVALGDRHSMTSVGTSGRVYYSGAPEPTSYSEVAAGYVLVVELTESTIQVKEQQVGTWSFKEKSDVVVNTGEDVAALTRWLQKLEDKARSIVKLRIEGTLSLTLHDELQATLDHHRQLLGALEIRSEQLVVIPNDEDFSGLELTGFAARSVSRLRDLVQSGGPEELRSRDALALLLRLVRRAQ